MKQVKRKLLALAAIIAMGIIVRSELHLWAKNAPDLLWAKNAGNYWQLLIIPVIWIVIYRFWAFCQRWVGYANELDAEPNERSGRD